jgi:hypothetical protein
MKNSYLNGVLYFGSKLKKKKTLLIKPKKIIRKMKKDNIP